MANRNTIVKDMLYFIKNDLVNNITDPIASTRKQTSKFIMTSYPQRMVQYPIITIKVTNLEAARAGMQITALDIKMNVEIRIWARNEKEKDELYALIMDRLANVQFATLGSVSNDFHDFSILSSIEIDEPGDSGIKSRILQVRYSFYNYD